MGETSFWVNCCLGLLLYVTWSGNKPSLQSAVTAAFYIKASFPGVHSIPVSYFFAGYHSPVHYGLCLIQICLMHVTLTPSVQSDDYACGCAVFTGATGRRAVPDLTRADYVVWRWRVMVKNELLPGQFAVEVPSSLSHCKRWKWDSTASKDTNKRTGNNKLLLKQLLKVPGTKDDRLPMTETLLCVLAFLQSDACFVQCRVHVHWISGCWKGLATPGFYPSRKKPSPARSPRCGGNQRPHCRVSPA